MKKLLLGLGIVIAVVAAALYFLNNYLENQLKDIIETKLPASINLTYEELDIDSWAGNAKLKNATVNFLTADTLPSSQVKNATVVLLGLDHWDYFKNKHIHFDKINIHADRLSHYLSKSQEKAKDSTSAKEELDKIDRQFYIEKFHLETGYIELLSPKSDSVLLYTARFDLQLEDLSSNGVESITKPFDYSAVLIKSDSIFFKVSPYETLQIAKVSWDGDNLNLDSLRLKTVPSRAELSKEIKVEKDHYDLQIPHISVHDLKYGNYEDDFFVNAALMQIDQPDLNLFRDKRLPDDYSFKPLYSKMLRDLPINLMIDSVKINQATLVYTERVNSSKDPGQIRFSSLNAAIFNLGNTYKLGEKKTQIDIDAVFMSHAPITVDWEFDVQNTDDQFKLNGSILNLDAQQLNRFTSPNLGVDLSGKLNQAYFSIYGNNVDAHIDMKMKYDAFKVEIRNQKKHKKKWLASTVANIFIAKTSKREDDGFKEGSGEVSRIQYKSFFNYLWLNLKEGLLKVLTLLD